MDQEALNVIIFGGVLFIAFLTLSIFLLIKGRSARKFNKELKRNCYDKNKVFDEARYKLNKQRNDLGYFLGISFSGTFLALIVLIIGLIRLIALLP